MCTVLLPPGVKPFHSFCSLFYDRSKASSPHSAIQNLIQKLIVLFYVLFVCKCVLYYCHRLSNQFIHLVVCFTTGPKRALHIVRSRTSSFKWDYPLLSLKSSSSFLRLLPRLPVTSIPPFIFPSITRCRRQFLRKLWPIQFAFRLGISCRIYPCSLTLSNTSSFLTWSVQLIFPSFSGNYNYS